MEESAAQQMKMQDFDSCSADCSCLRSHFGEARA